MHGKLEGMQRKQEDMHEGMMTCTGNLTTCTEGKKTCTGNLKTCTGDLKTSARNTINIFWNLCLSMVKVFRSEGKGIAPYYSRPTYLGYVIEIPHG